MLEMGNKIRGDILAMSSSQRRKKNETRLVGGEGGSQSVGKMKFGKCEKDCEKWRS